MASKNTQYKKDIKRINQRMVDLHEQLGKDDETFRAMQNYILTLEKNDGIKINQKSDGTWSISVSEKGVKLTQEQIARLLNYQTLGQKKKKAKETIVKERKENFKQLKKEMEEQGYSKEEIEQLKEPPKPTNEEVLEYAKMTSNIKKFIEENDQLIYKYEETYKAVKRGKGENKAKLYPSEVELLAKLKRGETKGLTEKDIFKEMS